MRNLEVVGTYSLPKYSYEGYLNQSSVTTGFSYTFSPYTGQQYTAFEPGDIAIMVTTSSISTSTSGWTNVYTTTPTNGANGAVALKLWKKDLTAGDVTTSATWSTSNSNLTYDFMSGLVLRTTSGSAGLYSPNNAVDYFFFWNGTYGGITASYDANDPYTDYYTVPALTKSSFGASDQYQRIDFCYGTSGSGAYSSGNFTNALPPNNTGFDYYSNYTEVDLPSTVFAVSPSSRPYSFDNNIYIFYGSFQSMFLIHTTANLNGTTVIWKPQRYQTSAIVGSLTIWVRKKAMTNGVTL